MLEFIFIIASLVGVFFWIRNTFPTDDHREQLWLWRRNYRSPAFLQVNETPGAYLEDKLGADAEIHAIYELPPSLYFEGYERFVSVTFRFQPIKYTVTYDFPAPATLRLVNASTGETLHLAANSIGSMIKTFVCYAEADYFFEVEPIWADGSLWRFEVVCVV